MKPENYTHETPLQRVLRQHEEDKVNNPGRHSVIKDFYYPQELPDLCIKCCSHILSNEFEHDFACNVIRRKKPE